MCQCGNCKDSWFVRAGMLWTEYLPVLLHPCWQALSSGGSTPQGQTEPLWSDHPLRFGLRHPQRAELVQRWGLQTHLSGSQLCAHPLLFA